MSDKVCAIAQCSDCASGFWCDRSPRKGIAPTNRISKSEQESNFKNLLARMLQVNNPNFVIK